MTSHANDSRISSSKPLCRFHLLDGHCRNGDECYFSHELPDNTTVQDARKQIPCRFFQQGNCRYGESCCFGHEVPSANILDSEEDAFTCGICLESVPSSGRKFGLLSNCNHVFCFDCLMNWRKEGSTEAEDRRVCPSCRKHSEYVIPSVMFAVGEEKKQIIDAIKAKRASIDCERFDGSLGSCPFGKDCFYAHLDSLGNDIKSQDLSMKELYEKREKSRSHSQRRGELREIFMLMYLRDLLASSRDTDDLELDEFIDLLELFGL